MKKIIYKFTGFLTCEQITKTRMTIVNVERELSPLSPLGLHEHWPRMSHGPWGAAQCSGREDQNSTGKMVTGIGEHQDPAYLVWEHLLLRGWKRFHWSPPCDALHLAGRTGAQRVCDQTEGPSRRHPETPVNEWTPLLGWVALTCRCITQDPQTFQYSEV